jgi:thiol-disulfide isomerase/thioredoxin
LWRHHFSNELAPAHVFQYVIHRPGLSGNLAKQTSDTKRSEPHSHCLNIKKYIMKKIFMISLVLLSMGCGTRKGGEPLPAFDLLLVDSVTKLNTSDIPGGKPIALLYFSPNCEHCQKETRGIIKYMDSLRQVRFYFITNDPFDSLKLFNDVYRLYRYPNITLGRDFKYFFPKYFKDVSPPYMAIYDEDKRLRAIFKGERETSQIIAYIAYLKS